MKLLYFLLLLHRKIKGPTVLTYQLIPLLKYKDKTKQIHWTTEYLALKSAPEFEREKKKNGRHLVTRSWMKSTLHP